MPPRLLSLARARLLVVLELCLLAVLSATAAVEWRWLGLKAIRKRPMELGQWLQMLLHHLHSPRLSPRNRPVLRLSPRARRGCPSRTPDPSPLRALTLRAAATGRDARLHFCK